MRLLSAFLLAIFSFLSIGCAVTLQPSQQGEWSGSNFHNSKYSTSKDVRAAEKATPEK